MEGRRAEVGYHLELTLTLHGYERFAGGLGVKMVRSSAGDIFVLVGDGS